MSSELESDRAMVMNLESFGVDGVGYRVSDRSKHTEHTSPFELCVSICRAAVLTC